MKRGDKVVFAGSANESTHALLPTHNYESINVFRTWIPEHAEFFDPHIESFERLWRNESRSTAVIDIPTAVKDKLISVARSLSYTPDPEIEAAIAARILKKISTNVSTTSGKPYEPATINGQPFQMRDHPNCRARCMESQRRFPGCSGSRNGRRQDYNGHSMLS